MRIALARNLTTAAFVLFLALFVFAVAAYGLTRESTLAAFEWAMGGTVALWVAAHALKGEVPHVGLLPVLSVGLVLSFGWLVTGMAILDDAITDEKLPWLEDWFPATMLIDWSSRDASSSLSAMVRTTVLLGSMLLAIDLWKRPRWAHALVLTMVLSAFATVFFFLLQRIFGGSFLLHSLLNRGTLAFATYNYHGNAASYLNLFWPIATSVAVGAALRQTHLWALWFIPAAAIFLASFLNISKAGNLLALIGGILFVALALPVCLREMKRRNQRIRPAYLLIGLIPVLIIATSLPFALPRERWEKLAAAVTHDPSQENRVLAYRIFAKMLPDSGWVGFGPGTFSLSHLRYVADEPEIANTPYWVAHEDYLQTLIEWGYLGTILWAFVLVPPVFAVLRQARQIPSRALRESEPYRITLIDHLAAIKEAIPDPSHPGFAVGAFVAILLTALHAAVDFPMQIASLQFYFLCLIALGWSYLYSGSREAQFTEE